MIGLKIISIIKGDEELVEAVIDNEVSVITDKTPFYGESGGQVGDIGEITINSRVNTFDTNAEILGSDNQTLMEEYISIIRKFNLENLDLLEIYYDSQINGNNKRFDSVNDAINNLIKRKYLYSLNFATTNANYEVSPYILTTEVPDANKELLKQVYDKFNDSIKDSKYGKLLMEIISN